jgi:putative oxidoreductase
MAKMGVPAAALVPTIALQLVSGLAIAVGWHARLGSMAFGLFCLATAALFHAILPTKTSCCISRA